MGSIFVLFFFPKKNTILSTLKAVRYQKILQVETKVSISTCDSPNYLSKCHLKHNHLPHSLSNLETLK